MAKPKPTYPLLLACDPGQRKADVWAGCADHGEWNEAIEVRADMNLFPGMCTRHLLPNQRILVAIEKPPGNWSRFRGAQTAANRVADQVRKLWPRRNKIVFVTPDRWRGDLGVIAGPYVGDVKGAAQLYCHWTIKPPYYAPEDAKDPSDYYDARCILQWLIDQEKAHRRGRPSAIGGK